MSLHHVLLQNLEPPPNLTISEWADRYRMLSPESSAEPGRWHTDRAPYQRAIMDAITDPTVREVVVMSSAQIGKSEMLLNIIGYAMDLDPGPMLAIQPTLEMAEAFSKDRIEPMLRDSPTLRKKVGDGRKNSANTIRHKTFPGGQITLAGSNSAAGLASRPIRYVLGDEIDRWEASVGGEGDPLALASKRSTTFWNRLHLWTSTPTIKGASRIEQKFAESDQRRCYVPCPHCDSPHVLEWKHVKWTEGEPETAHLVCPVCGSEISEAERQVMLRSPEWHATAEFKGIAGFHIWEAYSPWRRLADIVADFLEAKKAPDTLQVFVNTSLGETWEQKAEQADNTGLLARREQYPAQVPQGVCCLVIGADTQDDRLEALVIGFGIGEECWIVDSQVFWGDPARPEPWNELEAYRTSTFLHESGAQLNISATCVDTAGHRTQYVYDYVAKHLHENVYAIIGRDGSDRPIVSAPSKKQSGTDVRKVPLYTVGVDPCKSLFYSRLNKITEKGAGYVHLPIPHMVNNEMRYGVDEEFIAQLTSEKLIEKKVHGVTVRSWVKTRPRNESLDMAIYGIAALRLRRPNLVAMAALLNPNAPPKPTPPPPPQRQAWIPRQPGGWLRGRS